MVTDKVGYPTKEPKGSLLNLLVKLILLPLGVKWINNRMTIAA